MLGQKIFDIRTAETHDSANLMNRQFARFEDPLDCHWI